MIFATRRLSSGVASTFDGQTAPGLAPATTRQMRCFLHFRDQGPALGVPGVPWPLLEPHRLHMNGRRANKFGVYSPWGVSGGPFSGQRLLPCRVYLQNCLRNSTTASHGCPPRKNGSLREAKTGFKREREPRSVSPSS